MIRVLWQCLGGNKSTSTRFCAANVWQSPVLVPSFPPRHCHSTSLSINYSPSPLADSPTRVKIVGQRNVYKKTRSFGISSNRPRNIQNLEAFSPRAEKTVMQGFGAKTLGVCNAFLHIKLADQLKTRHSRNAFSTPGLNASIAQIVLITSGNYLHKLRKLFVKMGPIQNSGSWNFFAVAS